MDADGRMAGRGAFSVEKPRLMAMSADGATLMGATDDDAYLFRNGQKSRLMPGRRLTYAAIALDTAGARFAVAFADMFFSTHTVALGDTGGRIAWTRDLSLTVTAVALDREGLHVAAGSHEGKLQVVDAARAPVYDHTLDEPIAALALATSGSPAIVGTAQGSVVRVGPDGGREWGLSFGRPVTAVAVDAAGERAAAVAADASDTVLAVVDIGGDLLWEHTEEGQPTGLALSPNGRHLAVSLADGRLLAFSLGEIASAARPAPAGSARGEARAAWAAGEWEEARARARKALELRPR